MRHRRSNNLGCIFRHGARKPEKLRKVGDEAGAKKAEAALAKASWFKQYTKTTGQTVVESCHTTVKAEAQASLDRDLEAVRRGVRDPSAMNKVTMGALFDDVLLDYKSNGYATEDDAESRIRLHLVPAFGSLRACRFCNADAQEYLLARREAGASLATIANELGLVRRALRLGVLNGRLAIANPIVLPKNADVPRQGFLEPAQYRVLMAYLPENLRPMVSLAFFTGMRRGELLSLKWSQVDLMDGMIRLSASDTKTRQARTIPIAEEPLAMLRVSKVLRDQQDPTCNAVFYRARRRNVDGEGGPLAPLGDFRSDWMAACCAAKLGEMVGPEGKQTYKGLIFHDLRRSGVRQLVRSGVDEHVAMKISGHKTRSVFARYNIVSLDDLKAATKKLDVHLAVPDPEQTAAAPTPELVN